MKDDDPVPEVVSAVLYGHPDIEFVVAFGSRVDGHARPASDIDIAVKFSDTLSADERFRRRCRLAGQLHDVAQLTVDLSNIDDLPVSVAHAAVTGRLICGDGDQFREYRRSVESTFEVYRKKRTRRDRALISRVAEEGLRG